jgi:hypothetical protein
MYYSSVNVFMFARLAVTLPDEKFNYYSYGCLILTISTPFQLDYPCREAFIAVEFYYLAIQNAIKTLIK